MRRRTLMALASAALIAACSSPRVDLYTLAAVPGPQMRAAAGRVELRRVGLAGYLDRPEIVRSAADYRLRLSDQERWGEPLGGMIGRVFSEDLLQRLPGTAVYADTGAITARPDLVLEIDVQRFDIDAAGAVVLLAQIGMRHDDGSAPSITETLRVEVPVGVPDTAALVAAMSTALGRLADQVASRLARA